MKEGDIVEWRGANKTYQGVLTRGDDGEPIVMMQNGCSFRFKDIRRSKSLKLIEK